VQRRVEKDETVDKKHSTFTREKREGGSREIQFKSQLTSQAADGSYIGRPICMRFIHFNDCLTLNFIANPFQFV